MNLEASTTTTPAGLLTMLLNDGVVVASGFSDPASLAQRVGVEAPIPSTVDEELTKRIAAWLQGDPGALDAIPRRQPGTEFQRDVWQALDAIPAGTTATYAELARRVGRPRAVRAVGGACGANRLAPLVPCHRAVRSDGGLGGYAWGVDVKDWLLHLERGHPVAHER